MMNPLKALAKSQAAEILLFLEEKGEVRHAQLKRLAPASTLHLRLTEMERLGLICVHRRRGKPPEAYYGLTQLGHVAARLVQHVKDTWEGQAPGR